MRFALPGYSFGLYQLIHAQLMFIAYLRGKWLDVEVESVKDSEQIHVEVRR